MIGLPDEFKRTKQNKGETHMDYIENTPIIMSTPDGKALNSYLNEIKGSGIGIDSEGVGCRYGNSEVNYDIKITNHTINPKQEPRYDVIIMVFHKGELIATSQTQGYLNTWAKVKSFIREKLPKGTI